MDFKAGLYSAGGTSISGSSDLSVRIKRDSDDYFYDFDDNSFKASGHVLIDQQMSEFDAANMPGEYEVSIGESEWINGMYTVFFVYAPGDGTDWVDCNEFSIYSGRYISSGDAIEKIRDAIMDKAVDGSIDVEKVMQILSSRFAGDFDKSANTYIYKNQADEAVVQSVVMDDGVLRTVL